jgi:spore germination protein KC
VFEGEEAAQALKVTYPLQKVSSLKVNKQIDMFYKDWGGDPNVRLTDFISTLTSPGKEPALPIKDTRNYLWIIGLDSTSLTIPCEEKGKYVDIRIRRSRTEIDSVMENGVPHFNVRIYGEAKLEGSQCTADLEK